LYFFLNGILKPFLNVLPFDSMIHLIAWCRKKKSF